MPSHLYCRKVIGMWLSAQCIVSKHSFFVMLDDVPFGKVSTVFLLLQRTSYQNAYSIFDSFFWSTNYPIKNTEKKDMCIFLACAHHKIVRISTLNIHRKVLNILKSLQKNNQKKMRIVRNWQTKEMKAICRAASQLNKCLMQKRSISNGQNNDSLASSFTHQSI